MRQGRAECHEGWHASCWSLRRSRLRPGAGRPSAELQAKVPRGKSRRRAAPVRHGLSVPCVSDLPGEVSPRPAAARSAERRVAHPSRRGRETAESGSEGFHQDRAPEPGQQGAHTDERPDHRPSGGGQPVPGPPGPRPRAQPEGSARGRAPRPPTERGGSAGSGVSSGRARVDLGVSATATESLAEGVANWLPPDLKPNGASAALRGSAGLGPANPRCARHVGAWRAGRGGGPRANPRRSPKSREPPQERLSAPGRGGPDRASWPTAARQA